MKVTTGLLGAVVLSGWLFLVPAARADSDRVVFTGPPLLGPEAPAVTTWTMAADQGVVTGGPHGWLGTTFDPVFGGYLPNPAVINFQNGGVALYGVAFFLTPGGPNELWLQFVGFAVVPSAPFPNQPGGACEDQAGWSDCFTALYYGDGTLYPASQHPFSLSPTGDLTLNPGVYVGPDDCCGTGFTISSPEPGTDVLLLAGVGLFGLMMRKRI